jgi:T5SS/PEP-CTERM-associated repeat protein
VAFLLLSGCAAAQNLANWNTTTGNWGTANNWDCVINGVSSHCVPSAGFVVTNIAGDITLDVNANVAQIMGSTGSLTLNGKTLTATDPLGIQMAGGIVNMSGSAVINGLVIVNNLHLENSTINGNVQAFNASVAGGTLGSLTIDNQLTAANSTFGSSSNLTISQPSSISNSTIGGQFNVNGGSLTVDGGSIINSTQTLITTGSITVQGGSTWNATSTAVFLGLSPGTAALDVTGTGSVLNLTNAALELGEIASSTVTVEHSGSIAATGAGGNFLIGLGVVFPTDSKMIVNSGGTASANNITVESPTGSTGLLSVSDSPSSVTATGQLLVANGGVVNAANQGNLTANSLRIQSGIVTIDSGATLNVTSDTAVLIGSGGTGTLNVQGGGTANGPGQLVLGTSAVSAGTVSITGLGSTYRGSSSVIVGSSGAGILSVGSGGLLETGADPGGISGSIGDQGTGTGTVTLQGGDWQAGGSLQIGAAGSGTLHLLQAGTVESGAAVIGVSPGSSGTVTVADAGSKWTISGNLTVGSGGSGSLNITNGGLVTNGSAVIGELSGSNASASVSGVGSRWVNSGTLTVGQNGTGSMFVSGGGVVTNVNAVLGDKAGSSGSVTVTGLGSSWQNSGILRIGGDGAANLTIDTGTVTAGGAAMGSNFSPVQVTVTNHGTLSVLGDVSIGGAASTTLTIENGGTFDSGANATIGGAGGDTTVTVTGTDSSWALNGTGNLTIDDKGSLFVMDGGRVTSTSITVDSGGLLNGQGGNIIGSVFNHGGTVTPGDATGILSISGDYNQPSGVLLFEIDGLGPAQFDQLVISGLANITGGYIDIQFGNGFVPVAGESFDLISAAGGLILANVTFDVTGLPSGLRFLDSVGPNGFEISFAGGSSAPEPSGAALFVLGLGLILASRRKRSSDGRPVR